MVEDIHFWFEQAERLANQGFYGDALIQFDRVLELQPDFAPAWIFRAVVLLHLDRPQEALESCDRALMLRPADAEAWLFRGVSLQRLNRYPEAYASFQNALGNQTSSPRLSWQPNLPSLLRSHWLTNRLVLLWQSFRRQTQP